MVGRCREEIVGSGWLDAKGWRDAERAFLCLLFWPIGPHLLPVLSIMQLLVSRFVPFVLQWWKLEIGTVFCPSTGLQMPSTSLQGPRSSL